MGIFLGVKADTLKAVGQNMGKAEGTDKNTLKQIRDQLKNMDWDVEPD